MNQPSSRIPHPFWVLVRKEVSDHVRSWRFNILLALVVLASYGSLDLTFTQVDPGPEPLAAFRGQDAPRPQVLLLDTEIEPPAEISPTLVLTVTWQAVEPVAVDYTTFVHLLDADGDRVTQRDSQPCSGECPTSTWQPGTIVVDRYELALGAESPPGPYTLDLGLYLLESGERAEEGPCRTC